MSEVLEVLLRPKSCVDRIPVAVGEDSESVDWDDAVARFLLASVRHNPSTSVDAGQTSDDHPEVRTVCRSGRSRSNASIASPRGPDSNAGTVRRGQPRKRPVSSTRLCPETTLQG